MYLIESTNHKTEMDLGQASRQFSSANIILVSKITNYVIIKSMLNQPQCISLVKREMAFPTH
uniref:Transcriptional regulator n=1 Tax=Strongyloides stercoralis TaxID=6248 RepID=A0A0K0DZB8_STRER